METQWQIICLHSPISNLNQQYPRGRIISINILSFVFHPFHSNGVSNQGKNPLEALQQPHNTKTGRDPSAIYCHSECRSGTINTRVFRYISKIFSTENKVATVESPDRSVESPGPQIDWPTTRGERTKTRRSLGIVKVKRRRTGWWQKAGRPKGASSL